MRMYLGIDPGETTGVCVAYSSGDELIVSEAFELTWESRFQLLPLVSILSEQSATQLDIVVESFHLYKHRAQQQVGSYFPSVRVIGILETAAWASKILNRIIYQSASDIARVTVLPQHAKIVGGSEHTKDAYKHIRYHYVKHIFHPETERVSDGSSRTGSDR